MLAARSEPMERGHQERLAPLVREVAEEAGIAFRGIGRIGVTVGPGSFTGLRVGLALAKGMGLALRVPVIGVGSLTALAATAGPGLVAAAIDARREQLYLQVFRDGKPLMEPEALTAGDAVGAGAAAAMRATTTGSGAVLGSVRAWGSTPSSRRAPEPASAARPPEYISISLAAASPAVSASGAIRERPSAKTCR